MIGKWGFSLLPFYLGIIPIFANNNYTLTDRALRTVSVALLSLKGDFGVLYSVIFAAVIISMIPTVTVYLLAQEKVEKSIASGMIKG